MIVSEAVIEWEFGFPKCIPLALVLIKIVMVVVVVVKVVQGLGEAR